MTRTARLGVLGALLTSGLLLALTAPSAPAADATRGHGATGARAEFHDAMRKLGRDLEEELLATIRTRYVQYLEEEIQHRGHGIKSVLPGVRELLDQLSSRDDVFLGLVTGNFEEGARIKLEYFDLWRYFRCGAYGDDAQDRNALVPFALQRARACGLSPARAHDVLVVGDTPHDVACARAAGAIPVGVATGSYTIEEIRASGADVVFPDLSDTAAFLALL